jgi:hypothetical protein
MKDIKEPMLWRVESFITNVLMVLFSIAGFLFVFAFLGLIIYGLYKLVMLIPS